MTTQASRFNYPRHFQMQLQQAVFKPKLTVVPFDQFLNVKQILVKKRSIFHLPCVGFLKSVQSFRNLLLQNGLHTKEGQFFCIFECKRAVLTLVQFLRFQVALKCRYSTPFEKAARGLLEFYSLKSGKHVSSTVLGQFWPFLLLLWAPLRSNLPL